MYCRQCGEKLNNPKAVICIKCGTNKGQGENYCPDCGQEVKNKGAEVAIKWSRDSFFRLQKTIVSI